MSARPDTGGIVAGVLFVLVGVVFLLDELDVWTIRLSYVLPLVLIGVGLALLLGWLVAATSARQR
ncbi:MAG: DUF5668 domain-containing protein [Ilumatobacteraceae bacterium]